MTTIDHNMPQEIGHHNHLRAMGREINFIIRTNNNIIEIFCIS